MASVMSSANARTRPQGPTVVQKQVSNAAVKLSRCALKYAYALSDPFSPACTGVCVPSGQATASHKVTGFVRLDSKIGTEGFAYVMLCPSLANDAPQILYTTAAYARSDTCVLSAINTYAVGVARATVSNLPYTADDLVMRLGEDAQGVTGRVASVGLSVQYTGTALNQSGMIYMFRDPAHKNVSFAGGSAFSNTVASLSASPLTSVCNFTRERCSISDFACAPGEMNFTGLIEGATDAITDRTGHIYPFSGVEFDLPLTGGGASIFGYTTPQGKTYNLGAPTTVCLITGQPGQDFHMELVVHAEYTGFKAAASYTPTDSDVQGAGLVLEAANMVQQKKTQKPQASNWQLMYDGLAYAAKKAAPVLIPMAEKAILSLLI